jgi:hypothetical protein
MPLSSETIAAASFASPANITMETAAWEAESCPPFQAADRLLFTLNPLTETPSRRKTGSRRTQGAFDRQLPTIQPLG